MTTARERGQTARFVQRAHEQNADVLATPILNYAASLNISLEQLAETWSLTPDTLNSICLCRAPRPGKWGEDIAEIAAIYGVDKDRLHDLLWRALECS